MAKLNIAHSDTDHIAEFGLGLRNLSFLLDAMLTDETSLNRQNLVASLFALRLQVDAVAESLQNANDQCQGCTKIILDLLPSTRGVSDDEWVTKPTDLAANRK